MLKLQDVTLLNGKTTKWSNNKLSGQQDDKATS